MQRVHAMLGQSMVARIQILFAADIAPGHRVRNRWSATEHATRQNRRQTLSITKG
jgi:hypothetical protein